MMRRGACFDADQARWQLPKECQHLAPLELTTDDDIASRIDAVNLKDRLRDIETVAGTRARVLTLILRRAEAVWSLPWNDDLCSPGRCGAITAANHLV
jgi:hypothetical protein